MLLYTGLNAQKLKVDGCDGLDLWTHSKLKSSFGAIKKIKFPNNTVFFLTASLSQFSFAKGFLGTGSENFDCIVCRLSCFETLKWYSVPGEGRPGPSSFERLKVHEMNALLHCAHANVR